MSSKEGKRLRGNRSTAAQLKNCVSVTSSASIAAPVAIASNSTELDSSSSLVNQPFQSFGVSVKLNTSDIKSDIKYSPVPPLCEQTQVQVQSIRELMEAPVELDIPLHSLNRGPNPYLDRCIYCNSPRSDFPDSDKGIELIDLPLPSNSMINGITDGQSFSSLKVEIWMCASCRQTAGDFGRFQSLMEAAFSPSYDLPYVHYKTCDLDPLSCVRCQEEQETLENEMVEFQESWVELYLLVKDIHSSEEPLISQEQGNRLRVLVSKLCSQDPHLLFLRLEAQVREMVVEIQTDLLMRLKFFDEFSSPDYALHFTSSLLAHYDLLIKRAKLLERYLGELNEHMQRFNLSWELLNKHLFHSVAHSDQAISNSGPSILEQLKLGSLQCEKVKDDDPFSSVRKKLLRFQEEMSSVAIAWRECQQLIEQYRQQEVKNSGKEFTGKANCYISHVKKDIGVGEVQSSPGAHLSCHNCIHVRNDLNSVFMGEDGRFEQTSSVNGDTNSEDIDDNGGDEDDYADIDEHPDCQDLVNGDSHPFKIPVAELKNHEVIWEAVNQRQLLQQQHLLLSSQHSCAHCQQSSDSSPHCAIQNDIKASPQFDVVMSQTSMLLNGAVSCTPEALTEAGEAATDGGGGSDNDLGGAGVYTTCQCHACLKQSGHAISTSLPLQIPVTSPPAELHLYPHIHGLPPQHQPHYLLDLPPPLLTPIKHPIKLDFDQAGIQSHLTYAISEWETTMQPPQMSLTTQHHHQHHHRLPDLSADLLQPHLMSSASPFTFDLTCQLATHALQTSTTNTTSVFKTIAGKPLLASSILSGLNSLNLVPSEGSSVDPTQPLDFASLAKLPQSCVNLATSVSSSAFSSHSCSCSSFTTVPTSSSPVMTMASNTSKFSVSCHSPLPAGGGECVSSPIKWERSQHCRKSSSASKLLPTQDQQQQQAQVNSGNLPFAAGLQGPSLPTLPAVIKNLNFSSKHSHQSCSHPSTPRTAGLSPHPPAAVPHAPSSPSPAMAAAASKAGVGMDPSQSPCNNNSIITNIDVGTSTPCHDPECEAHHEDNCDSIDDSGSEKSSSTSTSNQKEGKYCDCCYCEFFGHNNAQVPKISTNYIEMKDRLRKKLKKRQSESKHKQESPRNGLIKDNVTHQLDPLEKKGLDGLLKFINGTETDSQGRSVDRELTAKAAKRARQRQRKLEEKARQAKSTSPVDSSHHEAAKKGQGSQMLNGGIRPDPSLLSRPEGNPKSTQYQSRIDLQFTPAQFSLDLQSSSAEPRSRKGPPSSSTLQNSYFEVEGKNRNLTNMKQEINRSSLIIESTRSTISLSQKRASNVQQQQQNLPASHGEPQKMDQILNVLHKQNKNKTTSQSSVIPSPAEQNGINRAVISAPRGKSAVAASKEGLKQGSQLHPDDLINGRISVNQTLNKYDHTPLNGCSNNAEKRQTSTGVHVNGKHRDGCSDATKLTSSVAAVIKPSSPLKNSVVVNSAAENQSPQSPTCGNKVVNDQTKPTNKGKKTKKKNKNGFVTGVDEIFMPKSESELDGDVDDFERELEEFKRFCFEPSELKERRKIAVNVNLKDIFKKKTGLV